MTTRVLVADGDAGFRRGVARALIGAGHDVLTAEDEASTLSLASTQPIDVALVAVAILSGERGKKLLQALADAELVVTADERDVRSALALAGDSADVVPKGTGPELLLHAVDRAIARRDLAVEARRARDESPSAIEVIAASPLARSALRMAESAAQSGAPVLLAGEPGTGKRLFARTIHERSSRRTKPLVEIGCRTTSADAVETELFGRDLLDDPEVGAILLDDVVALSPSAQERLLRRLDERATEPPPRSPPPRLFATAPADVRDLVKRGEFRRELFFRLGVVAIDLPPLRRRREDIPLLAHLFLQRAAAKLGRPARRIGPEAMKELRRRPWPGNVPELEATIARAVALSRGETLVPADLADELADAAIGPDERGLGMYMELPYADAKERLLADFDRAYTAGLLARSQGVVSEAARRAGLDRSNFRRLLKRRAKRPC